jgi:hypothetical protein
VCENGRAIFGHVFVEQDARIDIAQQSRQRGLAVDKRAIAQILASRSIPPEILEPVRRQGCIRPCS